MKICQMLMNTALRQVAIRWTNFVLIKLMEQQIFCLKITDKKNSSIKSDIPKEKDCLCIFDISGKLSQA